ncbi:TetR family transcriptional regulator [Rhodobacterales bacterium 52_120_T64]|nr:TetR family transcriptional regulator [Rhodobacterales bacterium 52_120_T64]
MTKASGRPPRSERDISEFRSKVVKHALTLYREEGFGAVSMRRLAREVGCAPMTIYAHFDGKTDILRHLWSDVLADMADYIRKNLNPIVEPVDRLQSAAQSFVTYWIDHPDHFRLVFMSNDVERSDVGTFMRDPKTLEHFQLFTDLVAGVLSSEDHAKAKTDTLVSAMIGMALCYNTIHDYPWVSVSAMTGQLVDGIIN